MAFQRLREALTREERCAKPIGESRQGPAGVVAERLERRVERQSGADQKCKLTQKNRNVARSRQFSAMPATAGQDSRRRDLGIDRQVSQILDAPHHLLARRCIDFTNNDLSCMRNISRRQKSATNTGRRTDRIAR
jgi:hypothetical protein